MCPQLLEDGQHRRLNSLCWPSIYQYARVRITHLFVEAFHLSKVWTDRFKYATPLTKHPKVGADCVHLSSVLSVSVCVCLFVPP